MQEVNKHVYVENFQEIFDWFSINVHNPGYHYGVVDLKDSHLKMAELYDDNGKIFFRVVLKATYDDVTLASTPEKNYREIAFLTQTPSDRKLLAGTATALQICYVQLDENDSPVNGLLFTYAENEYHRIG